MLKRNNNWLNSQNTATKIYLKSQPIWHDKDMLVVITVALLSGFLVGLAV
jgi:hypothetical protein|tara:strand:+ start:1342 stop:1491 length:150 start_codon:yes stop_codon:yes gene_type:complete